MLVPWLALGYPVLAHSGVWLHSWLLQWLALAWLLAVMLAMGLLRLKLWAWSVFIAGASALYFFARRGDGMFLLYVPPVAIPLFVLWLFARTLRRGQTPLVSKIAESMRGEPLPNVLRIYTRRITQLW